MFVTRAILLAILLGGSITAIAGAQTPAKTEKGPFTMRPKVTEAAEGAFRCESAPALFVGASLAAKSAVSYRPLQEWLQARFGTPVEAAVPASKLPDRPFVLAGLVKDHPALMKLEAEMKPRLPAGGLGDEGYLLEVGPARVLLAASRPAGVFYGALKLREMARDAGGLEIPAVRLADWPAMAWRGMHVMVGSRASLPAAERLLTEYLPRFRMNKVIAEVDYNFQFKSHPEMADANGLSVEDCRRLSQLARQNFIQLIPQVNCLGHQSWAANTGRLLTAHPEFDETPDVPTNNKGIYCRSWCPMHPDVNKFVFDLFDELIDAFQADAFHVGMDEVFLLGRCPRCKGTDNATLFARAVNDLHAHLVGKRKVQMLMWGDRFLDGKQTGYGEWEASENGTAPAIDHVPHDIILCDWHYETRYNDATATYPSVPYLQEKGFRVWPSGWRSEENVQLLTGCSLKHAGKNMLGYLATTWTDARSIAQGLAGAVVSDDEDGSVPGVVKATRKGARIAWEGSLDTGHSSTASFP